MMKDILGFGAFTRSIGLSTFRLITKINGTNFAKFVGVNFEFIIKSLRTNQRLSKSAFRAYCYVMLTDFRSWEICRDYLASLMNLVDLS